MRRAALDDLPLFADDSSIGLALLGVRRAGEWKSIVPIYERAASPKLIRSWAGATFQR